jgi:hypothetical protein
MDWRDIKVGALLLDLRTGHLHQVKAARTRRGQGTVGGWVRDVNIVNLVTMEDYDWPYDPSRSILPYAYVGG